MLAAGAAGLVCDGTDCAGVGGDADGGYDGGGDSDAAGADAGIAGPRVGLDDGAAGPAGGDSAVAAGDSYVVHAHGRGYTLPGRR